MGDEKPTPSSTGDHESRSNKVFVDLPTGCASTGPSISDLARSRVPPSARQRLPSERLTLILLVTGYK